MEFAPTAVALSPTVWAPTPHAVEFAPAPLTQAWALATPVKSSAAAAVEASMVERSAKRADAADFTENPQNLAGRGQTRLISRGARPPRRRVCKWVAKSRVSCGRESGIA